MNRYDFPSFDAFFVAAPEVNACSYESTATSSMSLAGSEKIALETSERLNDCLNTYHEKAVFAEFRN